MTNSASSSSKKNSSSSTRRRTSSTSKRRSILRKNGTKKIKKRVRIHSPKNETKMYSLSSVEKTWKQGSPSKIGEKCGKGIFPCVHRGVVFENREDWNDYAENSISRNASTGYRPVSSHRKSMMSSLSKKGQSAKRIPEEFRLYNIQTGEIFDIREFNSK